ncbi:MAG: ATP-binding protein [Mycobacteriales bacterium]
MGGPPARRDTPELRGRTALLETFTAALTDLRDRGRGRIVIVQGPPGIGKTRLLEESVARARAAGLTVLRASGDESLATRPFGLLHDALASAGLQEGLSRALDDRDAGAAQDPLAAALPSRLYQGIDAVLAVVDRESTRRPLVMVLDDLHWADSSTAVAAAALGRRTRLLPVLLVVAWRPEMGPRAVGQAVHALLRHGADRLVVPPLGAAEVAWLVADLVGQPAGPHLLERAAAAGGNPLLVIELVEALRTSGALVRTEGRTDIAAEAPLGNLREALLARLGYLDADAVALLRVAAVLAGPFAVEHLAAASGRPVAALAGPLTDAVRAGILVDANGGCSFAHDLLREAVHEELPPAVRSALHRAAAQGLAGAGASAALVAHHYAAAGGAGRTETIDWLGRAAREVAAADPAQAVELLERAGALMDPASPGRDAHAVDVARALVWAQRPDDAVAVAEEVLGRPHDRALDPVLRVVLGRACLARGNGARALAEFDAAGTDPALRAPDRTQVLVEVAMGRLLAGDLEEARRAAQRLGEAGRLIGDSLAQGVSLAVLALVADCRGRIVEAVRLARRAVAKVGERDAHHFPVHLYLAYTLMDADRFAEAATVLAHGRRCSEAAGRVTQLPAYHWAEAVRDLLTGSWDDALAEVDAGLVVADEAGVRHGRTWAHSVTALIAVHRDDLVGADRALRQARDATASGPQAFAHWAAWAAALAREARGDVRGAAAALQAVLDACSARGVRYEEVNLGPDVVRLWVDAGEWEKACVAAESIAEVAASAGTVNAIAAAARCHGLVRRDPAEFERAAAGYQEAGRPVEAAHAAAEGALALARSGARGAAPLLRQALAAYGAAGARRDAARARAAARAVGLRLAPPRVPASALTGTEAEVVRLLGEGLSNAAIAGRLFISARTVETHLTRVFAKLGVSSRLEAALHAKPTGFPGCGGRAGLEQWPRGGRPVAGG